MNQGKHQHQFLKIRLIEYPFDLDFIDIGIINKILSFSENKKTYYESYSSMSKFFRMSEKTINRKILKLQSNGYLSLVKTRTTNIIKVTQKTYELLHGQNDRACDLDDDTCTDKMSEHAQTKCPSMHRQNVRELDNILDNNRLDNNNITNTNNHVELETAKPKKETLKVTNKLSTKDKMLDYVENLPTTPEVKESLKKWIIYRFDELKKPFKTTRPIESNLKKYKEKICENIEYSMGKEWEDIYPAPSTKDDTTASLDEKLITLYSQLHTAARNGNFEAHVAKVPTLTKYCKNQKGVNDLKMRLLSFENTDISYATFRKEFISILKVLKSQEVPTK